MSSVANVALVPRGVKVDMSEVANVAAALSIQIVRDFAPIWGYFRYCFSLPEAVRCPYRFSGSFTSTTGSAAFRTGRLAYIWIASASRWRTLLTETGENWSLDASRECLKMLADPAGCRLHAGPMLDAAIHLGLAQHQVQYIVEICNPVQDGQYGYQINGVLVSDFFTPNYFDPAAAGGVRYDFVSALTGPLDVASNGCISWIDTVTSDVMQLQNFLGPDSRLHPQVVNLSHSNMFQEVLAKEALRPAIDRVTVTPDLLGSLSREQSVLFETRYRSVRHAAQINARRMQGKSVCRVAGVSHEQLLVPRRRPEADFAAT